MALTISRNQEIFNAKGQNNSNTAGDCKTHLIINLNSSKELTIDINEVTEIVESGPKVLESNYNHAQSWNQPSHILRTGNKHIFDEFRSSELA